MLVIHFEKGKMPRIENPGFSPGIKGWKIPKKIQVQVDPPSEDLSKKPPWVDEYNMPIEEKDIQITTYRDNRSYCDMMLRHIPTDVFVKGHGKMQRKLYNALLQELEQKTKEQEDAISK